MSTRARSFLDDYVKRPLRALEFSEPVWKLLNRKSRQQFLDNPPVLNNLQKSLVDKLREDGVVTTHIEDLFASSPDLYQDILRRLDGYKAGATQDPKKPHLQNFWDTRNFQLDPANGFTQFSLSPLVLDVANTYMGMLTKFLLCNAYLAKVNPNPELINSQSWHRDLHDTRLVMAFIYLTDVLNEGYGPFWYIKGSHKNKDWKKNFPFATPYSYKTRSFTEERVAGVIPKDKWEPILGKRGTIIIADTKGIHRGGHCTTHERIISVSAYTSGHRFAKSKRYSYPSNLSKLTESLGEAALYAIDLSNLTKPEDQNIPYSDFRR